MGIDGLSNLQEGGQMHDQDVPRDEMTAEELAAQGGDQPDDAQAAEADQVQAGHEAQQREGDGDGESDPDERTDDPKPVDDDSLPEDGDPEADDLRPEPIPKEDFRDPEEDTSDVREDREDAADLSGVEKEFEE